MKSKRYRREDPFAPYYGYRKKKIRDWLFLILVILIIIFLLYRQESKKIYAVYIDNKVVAYLKEEVEAKNLLQKIHKEKAGEFFKESRISSDIKIKAVKEKRELPPDYLEVAYHKLTNVLELRVNAYAIVVSGKHKVVVKDKKVAEEVLNYLKNKYCQPKGEIKKLYFKEKIEIIPKEVSPENIATSDLAKAILDGKRGGAVYHTIKKGEVAYVIAKRYGISLAELKRENPMTNLENLKIGEKLLIKTTPPVLTVICEQVVKEKRKIPFGVEVKKDKTLYQDQIRVIQEGIPGEKEVTLLVTYENNYPTHKKVLKEKVLKKSVAKRIIQGTKVRHPIHRSNPRYLYYKGISGERIAYQIYLQYRRGNEKGHFRGVYGMKELGVSVGTAHSLNHAFGMHFGNGMSWQKIYSYLQKGDHSFGGRWGCSGGPHDPYSAAEWIKKNILK